MPSPGRLAVGKINQEVSEMTRTTKTQKTETIIAVRKGSEVTFHAQGCQHQLPKLGTDVAFVNGTFTSKEAVGADWWSDINAETDGPAYDWQDGELSFAKCVTLPDWEGGEPGKPSPKPVRTGKVTNPKGAVKVNARARARAALWAGIQNQLDDSLLKADAEMYALMVEQSERVAKMFGLRG
jgi:hypothetical protein